jgi:hypothetical protein
MSELHNGIVQHNDLSINNITLHWELDESLKIEVCNWGCTLHILSENLESFWHVEIKEAKEKLKEEKWWVDSSCMATNGDDLDKKLENVSPTQGSNYVRYSRSQRSLNGSQCHLEAPLAVTNLGKFISCTKQISQ